MSSPSDATHDADTADRVLAIATELVRETHPAHRAAVTLHSSLERDLGLDSLGRVELMLRIGQAFSVQLPDEALAEAQTPQDVLRFLGQVAHVRDSPGAEVWQDSAECSLPEKAQTLVDALEWHAQRLPERAHILLYDDRHELKPLRYLDLLEAARAAASGLVARGLQRGQTVALMLPTGRDYLACFFGVMLAGGIPVPIYPPARLAQIGEHLKRHARILANAEATLIITVAQAQPVALMLRAAVPSLSAIVTPDQLAGEPMTSDYRHPRADDIAFLQYTSGSTGDPKGVVLTHANLLANIRAMGEATRVTPGDVFVSWLPLYHDMGLISAWFGSLYFCMPLVLMSPLAFLARPLRWLQAISHHRGTISGAPNFAYELCVRNIDDAAMAGLDLSTWRLAFNGAEPVNPATLESFAAHFARCGLRREALAPVYGLAECSVGLAVPPPGRGPSVDRIRREPFISAGKAVPAAPADADAIAIPCCGRPLPGHGLRIVDPLGQELPERSIGRLEFRGPSATSGYYRNPEATAALFNRDWLDSGDHAYMADGELYITGRVKDLIKRGGRNLYPYDLEAAVGGLPGIRKGCVAVFASADPATRAERLVVMAETREQRDDERERLRRRIHELAIDLVGTPADEVALVPPHSVPKTSSGKIRRLAARQVYESGAVGKKPAPAWLQAALLLESAIAARITLLARQAGKWLYGAYAWTVFAVIALPVAVAVMMMRRPPAARRLVHAAAGALFSLIRLPLSASGLERLPPQTHVLIVNHSSYLDAILLLALLPPTPGYAFVAKREFVGQPLIRAVLEGLGTLFVERHDAAGSVADLETMIHALRHGERLLVFPEGTFRREAGLRAFHAGAFLCAARSGAPVVVAGLRGARAMLRDETWLPRRCAVELEIGPVMQPPGRDWAATNRLGEAARKEMLALTREFDWLA